MSIQAKVVCSFGGGGGGFSLDSCSCSAGHEHPSTRNNYMNKKQKKEEVLCVPNYNPPPDVTRSK